MIELNDLPDEVLCMILSQVNSWHICNLFRVCRRWKYLCSERVHFKFIDMGQYHRDMHKYMMQNMYQIENVCWRDYTYKGFTEKFFKKYQKLKSITLKDYRSPMAMTLLGKQKHLTHLSLAWVNMIKTDELANCKNLTSLTIDHEHRNNSMVHLEELNKELKPVFEHCKKLSILKLDSIYVQDNIMSVVPCTLTTIEMIYNTRMTDATLKHIGERCHFLEKITLHYNGHITKKGIDYIAMGCVRLVYANITKCFEINDFNAFINLIDRTKIRTRGNFIIDDVIKERLINL